MMSANWVLHTYTTYSLFVYNFILLEYLLRIQRLYAYNTRPHHSIYSNFFFG